jgi:prevent-host-death family protein
VAWQLHDAKQRFSALVGLATTDGPQVVTRHGREVVVVVSIEEYRRLRGDDPDLRRFIIEAPLLDLEIDRPAIPARRIEL